MARTIRDAKLETRAARDRLGVGTTPHFKTLVPGKLHLGYRRKRKDEPGQWIVRHYLGAERYHIAPLGLADDFHDATNDSDVLSFAEAQRAALVHKQARHARTRGKTVADALDDYVKALEGEGRDNAARDARRVADKLIGPQLGGIKLAELTSKDVVEWRNDLAKQPARLRTRPGEAQKFAPRPETADEKRARRSTVNRLLSTLKAALNAARQDDGKPFDPVAWKSVEPFEKADAARAGYLTVAECKRLVNAADADSGFRNLIRGALYTGCRYGELCALKVRDFHRGKIAIHRSKSGKPRDVVLNGEGTAYFTQLVAGRAGGDLMFPRADGGPWVKSMQFRPMRRACKAAKITPVVGFHQLRHTYASLSVMAEMPLLVLARNLGHTDTRMVEKHYGHLRQDYIDEQVRAAAPTFGFKPDKKITGLPR